LAISLAVTFYTLGQTKIYVTSSTVQFDPTPPRPLGKDMQAIDMGAGDRWGNREYCETQYKIIQSMRVALSVVRELDLNHDGGFIRMLPAGMRPAKVEVEPDLAADILRNRLKVEPVKDSRLAVVKIEDADPQRAERILRTLVNLYIEQNLDDALASTSSAVEWLRGQLDKLKNDLEGSELALHQYKLSNNILSVAFDDQSNMLREEVKQLNEALTAVRTRREELAARRNELLKIAPDDPSNLPARELLQSTLLQGLRQRYDDANQKREALIGQGMGLGHPEVAAIDAGLKKTREALLTEVRNIEGAVERDLAAINQEERGLAKLFAEAQKRGLELNLLEIEYNRLKRTKNNTEKLYELVLERTKESDLTRVLRVNNIRVIDAPLLPRGPVRPRVPLQIGLGILAGIFLGVVAAIGRAMLDRTLKTPDDVERELGTTFLGLLPELEGGGQKAYYARRHRRRAKPAPHVGTPELVVHDAPASGVAEAARAIRTNIVFMAPDRPYQVLLVTSAGSAEGKTTVACCLAIAMAQAGQRVVLVDCDLRRPRVHRIFKTASTVGVSTALIGDFTNSGAVETDVPNLTVIPAGPIPPNPAELLQSERFKTFLAHLRGQFDRVIIDSPPIVPVTDATILATVVDATVLVVRAFVTTNDLARHGARSLSDVGGVIAGVVLNAVDLDRHEYKYYYYSYKRDGYYASPSPTGPSDVQHGPGAGSPPPDQMA
jgi:capsular exopolysaccharide synthesis family protein